MDRPRRRRNGRNIGPALNHNNARVGARVRCTSTQSMQGQHGVLLGKKGSDAHVEFQGGKRMWIQMRNLQLVVNNDPTKAATHSDTGMWYVPPLPAREEYDDETEKGLECRSCGSQFTDRGDAALHVQAGCYGMGAARQQVLADADSKLLKNFIAQGGDPEMLKTMNPDDVKAWVEQQQDESDRMAMRPDLMRVKDADDDVGPN